MKPGWYSVQQDRGVARKPEEHLEVSQETRDKLRAKRLGAKATPETRRNMSESAKAAWKFRREHSPAAHTTPHNEESCKKISEALKRYHAQRRSKKAA